MTRSMLRLDLAQHLVKRRDPHRRERGLFPERLTEAHAERPGHHEHMIDRIGDQQVARLDRTRHRGQVTAGERRVVIEEPDLGGRRPDQRLIVEKTGRAVDADRLAAVTAPGRSDRAQAEYSAPAALDARVPTSLAPAAWATRASEAGVK
jgi:hypothetical protein